jgi:hypothetical protein
MLESVASTKLLKRDSGECGELLHAMAKDATHDQFVDPAISGGGENVIQADEG